MSLTEAMEKISREEAEKLIQNSVIINSKLEQDKNQICVLMTLSDNKICLFKYDIQKGEKSYFLKNL